jgi:hypothetical protein
MDKDAKTAQKLHNPGFVSYKNVAEAHKLKKMIVRMM